MGKMYRDLIQTDYFRVVVVDDVEAVEVCGALKVRIEGWITHLSCEDSKGNTIVIMMFTFP